MTRIVSEEDFDSMVAEALDSIPDEFLSSLENVAISVEDRPDRDDLMKMGFDPESESDRLLGLYVGYPQTERGNWDIVAPDKISIYRIPLCDSCETESELRHEVRRTLLHELGHYFGLSDERLDQLGWN